MYACLLSVVWEAEDVGFQAQTCGPTRSNEGCWGDLKANLLVLSSDYGTILYWDI